MMFRSLSLLALASCTSAAHLETTFPSGTNDFPLTASYDRVDRVSPGPSPIADGNPDIELTATVQGPIASIIVAVCSDGAATASQWDTIAGEAPLPAGFVWRLGKETWVLGVSDSSGTLINAADGSLPPMELAEPTTLTLSAADNGSIESGTAVCAWVMRPDGTSLRASTRLP